MNIILPSNFYTQFKAPNAKELIKIINSYQDKLVNNSKFNWGEVCSSDKIPLKFFLKFFQNHDLFKLKKRPQWYTITNRSRTYVKKITDKINIGLYIK